MDRITPADSDLAVTPKAVGRRWVWPSGYSAPMVAGAAGAERPTFPADLATLSVAELQALVDSAVAWSTENASAESTTENYAAMAEVHAGYQRAAAELASRPPEADPPAPTPSLADLAASMVPVTTPPVAAVVAATDPPAPEGPAATGTGGFSLEALVTAVTAGVQAALPQPTLLVASAEEGDLAVPDLDSLAAPVRLPARPEDRTIRPVHTITAAIEVPGVATAGGELTTWQQMGDALIDKTDKMRGGNFTGEGEFFSVAKVHANFPPERTLVRGQTTENMAKLEAALGPAALLADGGPCVPAMPYYGLMVDAGAERPLLAALSTWVLDRMGVTYLTPPTIDDLGQTARVVTDGATNTNTTVTSASAAFLQTRDRGALISGTGIPAGAYIVDVVSATQVTISAAATATATGVTITITRRGAVGTVTAAQDLAALDAAAASAARIAGSKYAYHVTCPGTTTVTLDAIYWFLEFGNWTAKAFPEQIPATVKLALAVYARRAESALLTQMKAASTSHAGTAAAVGAIRAYICQIEKAVEYLRNRHRLPESRTIRLVHPRWLIAALAGDVRLGSGQVEAFLTEARSTVRKAMADMNVVVSDYIDSAAGDSQLFAPGPGAIQGGKLASGGTLTYPATAASFLFPEGSFLAGISSSIDFGIYRDSFLNEQNNYRMGFEGWEKIVPLGYEMLAITSTLAYNGTAAGAAYGSETLGSPVALPTVW